jgi:signal peptide peptidase SppA
MRNMHIAELLFNRPLLISEAKLNVILHVLGPRLNLDLSGLPKVEAAVLSEQDQARAGYQVQNGIATIGVYGPLMNRVMRSEFPSGGPTTYADIRGSFDMALADEGVSEIKLEIDSPGGDVSGAFDLADHIYEARGLKPITAVVNESAFSAGYLLASSASRIIVPRTATVGSIGVIMTHADFSRAENEAGITVTHITAGAKKADFSPHMPLSDSAFKDAQSLVNGTYDLFVQTVARNRNMSDETVRGTEAGIFRGAKAVEIGLADEIMPAAKAISMMSSNNDSPMMPMGNNNQSALGGNATAEITEEEKHMTRTDLKEQHPALYAEIFGEGRKEGMVAGASVERERIQGVLALPGAAAVAHKAMIQEMAFDGQTSMESAAHRILMAEEKTRLEMGSAIQSGAVQAAPAADPGETSTEEKAVAGMAEQMIAGAQQYAARQ